MKTQTDLNNEQEVRLLYQSLLDSWNNHIASDFAKLFTSDGNAIGFDGSQMNGQNQIEKELSKIFVNHEVANYISIVREIRSLSPTVFLLRAVAGMIKPGESKINSKVNVIQTLIAQKEEGQLRISIFQNTPAAFHGRPDLAEHLTNELQEAFDHQVNHL